MGCPLVQLTLMICLGDWILLFDGPCAPTYGRFNEKRPRHSRSFGDMVHLKKACGEIRGVEDWEAVKTGKISAKIKEARESGRAYYCAINELCLVIKFQKGFGCQKWRLSGPTFDYG